MNTNDFETPGDSLNGEYDTANNNGESTNGTTTNHVDQSPHDEQTVEEEGEESNLLFSCQCDSARTIATLLSCLRRVITSGSGGSIAMHNTSSSSTSHNTQGATQYAYSQRGTQANMAL